MKNKFIWLPVALIAVVVVGVAVWFGNTATQKGSFPGLQPIKQQPSLTIFNPNPSSLS